MLEAGKIYQDSDNIFLVIYKNDQFHLQCALTELEIVVPVLLYHNEEYFEHYYDYLKMLKDFK